MDARATRMCRLNRRPDFDGYGFILQSSKKMVGHFVSEVEASSPASLGGVRVGDRVAAVNGYPVRDQSHTQLVKYRPDAAPSFLTLCDAADDKLFNDILANTHHILFPLLPPDVLYHSKTVRLYAMCQTANCDSTSKVVERIRVSSHHVDLLLIDVNSDGGLDPTVKDSHTSGQDQDGQLAQLSKTEPVVGVASMDDKLYVLIGQQVGRLFVFDVSTNYGRCRKAFIPAVGRPIDLAACNRYRCLYIADCGIDVIHKVTVIDVMMTSSWSTTSVVNSSLKSTRWPVGDSPCGVSVVPSSGRVLVTCTNRKLVKQFTADGQPINVVQVELSTPYHVVRIMAGQLIVCHGGDPDSVHGVSVIAEETGALVESYGRSKGPEVGRMNSPWHVAVDDRPVGIRFVYVADFNNGRVTKLVTTNAGGGLAYSGEVLSRDRSGFGWMWMPFRLCLDQSRRVLYVAENRMNENCDFSASRVTIIDLSDHKQ